MTPQPSEQPTTYDRELFLRIAEHLQRAARETGYTHPEHLSGSEYPATDIPCLPEIVAEQIVEKYLIEAEAAAPDPVATPINHALERALAVLTSERNQAVRLLHDAEALLNQPLGKSRHELGDRIRRFLEGAVATPAPLDAYDMRIMVRALYTSGLTDDMNPSDRRKAALRLRQALQDRHDDLRHAVFGQPGDDQRVVDEAAHARLGQPAGEEPE